jgi:hypothetical protein
LRAETIIREWLERRKRVPELGERHTLCDWVQPEDGPGPWVDEQRFGELLTLLPDKVVDNLVKAKQAQDGRIPLLKAGLGYEECLSSIIVDGTQIASSSTQANLVPPNLLPANYLQPGGIPGRTLKILARGRHTTLTTAATMTVSLGTSAAVATAPQTVVWATSGAMAMDVTVQTATQWVVECGATVRSVGSTGTVFAQGDASLAAHLRNTAALEALRYMGSAGSATPSTATVDMTVANYLQFQGKWSLSTAYSIQAHRFMLEALN